MEGDGHSLRLTGVRSRWLAGVFLGLILSACSPPPAETVRLLFPPGGDYTYGADGAGQWHLTLADRSFDYNFVTLHGKLGRRVKVTTELVDLFGGTELELRPKFAQKDLYPQAGGINFLLDIPNAVTSELYYEGFENARAVFDTGQVAGKVAAGDVGFTVPRSAHRLLRIDVPWVLRYKGKVLEEHLLSWTFPDLR